jgi:hypothetical protein
VVSVGVRILLLAHPTAPARINLGKPVRAPVGLVGCQLELWADELEEIEPGKPESIEAGEGSRGRTTTN